VAVPAEQPANGARPMTGRGVRIDVTIEAPAEGDPKAVGARGKAAAPTAGVDAPDQTAASRGLKAEAGPVTVRRAADREEPEGTGPRARVRIVVSVRVSAATGTPVRAGLRAQVRDATAAPVRIVVSVRVSAATGARVRTDLGARVEDALAARVRIVVSVRVSAATGTPVRAGLRAQVRDATAAPVRTVVNVPVAVVGRGRESIVTAVVDRAARTVRQVNSPRCARSLTTVSGIARRSTIRSCRMM
jgi:hypothetical protein